MTTIPRDAIGLSERLRRLARITSRAIETGKMVSPWSADSETLAEAATQLDALSAEREALYARLDDAAQMDREKTVRVVDAESRATRAEQERDEALEFISKVAPMRWQVRKDNTIRRLASGPDKEKRE